MKNVIINWDKTIFDGENRLLPDVFKLYTQIYSLDKKDSWSLVFNFDKTPRNQGYKTIGKVDFLVNEAPKEILVDNFQFDFLDGAKKVGECKIIEEEKINFSDIVTWINIIEEEKLALKKFVKLIRDKKIEYEENDLRKIILLANDYPFIFSLILDLNKNIAFEYLEKYFFKQPLENNTVYQSNLQFFLYNVKEKIGDDNFIKFISSLSNDIKNHEIIQKAIEEIF